MEERRIYVLLDVGDGFNITYQDTDDVKSSTYTGGFPIPKEKIGQNFSAVFYGTRNQYCHSLIFIDWQ